MNKSNKPLDGIRVIDLTHMLSGPYGSMILADLGCETIKVEPIVKPNTTISVPIHFPKIKPPISATGDAKPKKGKTHKIVKTKKKINVKNKLEFLIPIR